MACSRHFVIYDLPLEILKLRLIRKTADLNEPEPVIHEYRMPHELSPVPGDVKVPGLGCPEVLGVEFPVLPEGFRETRLQGISRIQPRPDLKPAHHILPHVQNISPSRQRAYRNRPDDVLDLNVGIRLRCQLAGRSLSEFRGRPPTVIVRGIKPPVQFHPGIVDLAVVLIIGAYRTFCGSSPVLAAKHSPHAAVGIYDLKLTYKTRKQFVVPLCLASRPRADDEPRNPPGPERHTKRVGSSPDQIRDIETVVIHGLVIVGHSGHQNLLTSDLDPVDICLIKTQSADVKPGLPDFPPGLESRPQVPRREGHIPRPDILLGSLPDPGGLPKDRGISDEDIRGAPCIVPGT